MQRTYWDAYAVWDQGLWVHQVEQAIRGWSAEDIDSVENILMLSEGSSLGTAETRAALVG